MISRVIIENIFDLDFNEFNIFLLAEKFERNKNLCMICAIYHSLLIHYDCSANVKTQNKKV